MAQTLQAVNVIIVGGLDAEPPQRTPHNECEAGPKLHVQLGGGRPQNLENQSVEEWTGEEEPQEDKVDNAKLTEALCKDWGPCFPQTWMDKTDGHAFAHRRHAHAHSMAQLGHAIWRNTAPSRGWGISAAQSHADCVVWSTLASRGLLSPPETSSGLLCPPGPSWALLGGAVCALLGPPATSWPLEASEGVLGVHLLVF